jgi:hypothetical protein
VSTTLPLRLRSVFDQVFDFNKAFGAKTPRIAKARQTEGTLNLLRQGLLVLQGATRQRGDQMAKYPAIRLFSWAVLVAAVLALTPTSPAVADPASIARDNARAAVQSALDSVRDQLRLRQRQLYQAQQQYRMRARRDRWACVRQFGNAARCN